MTNPEAGEAAVIVGATGGIGAALADAVEGWGRFAVVHRLSRSSSPAIDLENEASIAEAAARIGRGPAPTLILVATGVLHHGQEPERSYRALTAEHMLRDYRINTVGPALVAKYLLPLLPRDRRAVFAVLSARVGSIGDNRLGGWHSYRASKAALNMVLRNLATGLIPRQSSPASIPGLWRPPSAPRSRRACRPGSFSVRRIPPSGFWRCWTACRRPTAAGSSRGMERGYRNRRNPR